ncbi:helix-turn-helix domain protein [Ancylobacter novellus DSM 506]|uniref:Helix-turn-helix domain protein n=1 Tax=Ancylobacter novellus (strain ATCC 8093 / DSM 506 / JCM 20403 / CCM 1077 / IAM 12100 / NBRC 12443 / NCIMB 10456) TaxID=639283 RepID=D7A2P7_ANCN5|nr:helix-turn-helix transcriptional regulator [Ancylobacter novellus]ADH91577.1 helix-turn-helix domain protein [Ancylobacter novellus DSM 506]
MPSSFRSGRHKRLAELLERYRREADMKQADVAKRLGRHQPLITNMENGQRRIDVIELLELAEIIGFNPHDVLDELLKVPKGD